MKEYFPSQLEQDKKLDYVLEWSVTYLESPQVTLFSECLQ
jgi:hypothetical protein